jgi:hypothetical protein
MYTPLKALSIMLPLPQSIPPTPLKNNDPLLPENSYVPPINFAPSIVPPLIVFPSTIFPVNVLVVI